MHRLFIYGYIGILLSIIHQASAADSYTRFLLNELDNCAQKISSALPITFQSETYFMSHWIDEGSNVAPHGLNIHQFYRGYFTVDAFSVGYEYFQADFEHAHPHTLERGHTFFSEFSVGKITLVPLWTYIDIPHEYGDDSGELGLAVSFDIPLNPSFMFNYDYDEVKGFYFEWSISHEFSIEKNGCALVYLTPSATMGLDADKASENVTFTHIDFGLDATVPFYRSIMVSGFIHFTKGLRPSEGFESVVPWGGFALSLEL